MSDSLRLGAVGLGMRGRKMFALALKTGENVIPACVCDNNPAMWYESNAPGEQPLCEIYKETRFYEDYAEMLSREKIDAMLVETPAYIHAQFCADALKADIPVMSDIPLVRDLQEAQMLYDAEKNSKAFLMTGANPNEWGFVEAAYDLHQKGALGEIVYMEAEYIHDCRRLWEKTPWRKTGLIPITYCTHSLGPLLRLLGEDELKTVSCVSTKDHLVKGEGHHDLMTAHFTTKNNVVVRLTISFINEAKCGHHAYRIMGTEGYFERLSERGRKYPARTMFSSKKIYGAQALTELPIDLARPDFEEQSKNSGHGGADYMLFHHFFNAVQKNDKSSLISLKDGLRMTLPGIFAAESAMRGGELLKISYPWDNE